MNLHELKPLFKEEDLKTEINPDQIGKFYESFEKDFIKDPFQVNSKKIKMILKNSNHSAFKNYPETFAHIITRKMVFVSERLYECNRANRIHWIKPILQSHPCKGVKYYKWKDEKGICKEHFWFFAGDFMVVLKEISPDYQIVTAFCVDKDERSKYFERFKNYEDGSSDCGK